MDPQQHTYLLSVATQLEQHPFASGFLEPVCWKKLRLYDYPKFVTSPMDLGTVSKRLKENVYTEESQFWSDVHLIWSNCFTYNREDSTIFQEAVKMVEATKEFRKAFCLHFGLPIPSHDAESDDLRLQIKLAYRMACLPPSQLGKVIKFLEGDISRRDSKKKDVAVTLDLNLLTGQNLEVANAITKTLYKQLESQMSSAVGNTE